MDSSFTWDNDPLDSNDHLILSSFASDSSEAIVKTVSLSLNEVYDSGSDDEDIVVEIPVSSIKNSGPEVGENIKCAPDDSLPSSSWRDGTCKPKIFPFIRDPGPLIDVTLLSTALDFFQLFITSDVIEKITEETNHYASSYLQSSTLSFQSRFNKWFPTTPNEIRAFIGLITAMGLIKLADIDEYWSQDEMYSLPFFASTMTRDRFLLILTFLHCNNNENLVEKNEKGFDALFKVRPFLDALSEKFLSVMYPGQNIGLDEAVVAWRGPLGYNVYNPDKPDKCGVKIYQVCDSTSGYCSAFEVYVDKKDASPKGATYDLAMRLLDPFLDAGHHLYVDSYFTSPCLFQDLAARQTNACGTVRYFTKGVPDAMKKGKKVVKKRGDEKIMNDGNLNMIKFFANREVDVLSSIHTGAQSSTGKLDYVTGEVMKKYDAVTDYNKNMGGSGCSDQMIELYCFKRRTMKLWKKLFFHFLMLAELNAYIVYKITMKARGEKVMEHKIFRRELAKSLSKLTPSIINKRKRPIEIGNSSLQRLTARHFPSKVKGKRKRLPEQKVKRTQRRNCAVCFSAGKRRESTIECASCDVGLCIYPCFNIYHSEEDYGHAKRRYDENGVLD